MITPRTTTPLSTARRISARLVRAPATLTEPPSSCGPRDRYDAMAGEDEQRDDREHERRRRAIRGDGGVRAQDGLGKTHCDPTKERHPERPQASDQRRSQGRD